MKATTIALVSCLCVICLIVLVSCGKKADKRGSDKSKDSSYEDKVDYADYDDGQDHGSPLTPRIRREIERDREWSGLYPEGPERPGTEEYDAIAENRFLSAVDYPLSTFSIDVDTASYSNVRRFINSGQLPPKDAVRIEELINYFTYDYPQPAEGRPFSIAAEVGTCPWKPANRLVHIGLQGRKVSTEKLPPMNIVFLIDVSGSMSDSNKLPLLKSAFRFLIDKLRPEDRVSIVTYAGRAGVALRPTSGDKKSTILAAVDGLRAGGSTAGGEGINLAYQIAKQNYMELANNRVILATDGDFNVGVSSDAALVELIEQKREEGVFLTVLGFGQGNYKDAKMEKLADKGNGNYAYIDNLAEGKKVLANEFGATLFTIAKDVKIQVEFNPAKVESYRLIGYENRMLEKEDFEDDTKDAGDLGSGHTVTALYEIVPAGPDDDRAAIDESVYEASGFSPSVFEGDQMMLVKLRYKPPLGSTSTLIEQPVVDANTGLQATSDNFRFSAAVAEFGMLLRDSSFKGGATYEQATDLATNAKGADLDGYRKEFIRLVRSCTSLRRN